MSKFTFTMAAALAVAGLCMAAGAAATPHARVHPHQKSTEPPGCEHESPQQCVTAALEAMGWRGEEGISDMRMFLHYFRKTPDGRVLMGSGSGPIAFNGHTNDSRLREDPASAERAERGLRRLLPSFRDVPIARAWGGQIDVSADRLPFFKTIPGTRIHFGCGYSGHGVNPTYIGGQCLASLVLNENW